jgi:hypothetical protein
MNSRVLDKGGGARRACEHHYETKPKTQHHAHGGVTH